MNIIHLIISCSYTDGFSYQENLLPKYHKKAGNQVSIITNCDIIDVNGKDAVYCGERQYTDENGIHITRLPYRSPKKIYRFFRRYSGLMQALCSASVPDVLFIHSCQFLDISVVVKYLKQHPGITVYVDNHADFYNSAQNFLSKKILHGVIWKRCAQKIAPYATKFYGVLPARVDFLHEAYNLPKEQCELLVMGVDDDVAQRAATPEVKAARRAAYGVCDDDFVIITGGKINRYRPQVLTLMKAVNSMDDAKLKLVVFGSVDDELKEEFDRSLSERVKYIGWRKTDEIYEDYAAADLVAFPGLHSVLWEQATGMGKPCAFKRISGFEHVDLGGNCVFFESDYEEEYKRVIKLAQKNIRAMEKAAQEKGSVAFSYKEIAKRALEPQNSVKKVPRDG